MKTHTDSIVKSAKKRATGKKVQMHFFFSAELSLTK